jgi:pimeloyl-ACP methyl ester carboxylesterase
VRAPTLPLVGGRDFVRAGHTADMQRLLPEAQLAVLPDTTHMTPTRRTPLMLPLLGGFFM